jgi:hypothetical protein
MRGNKSLAGNTTHRIWTSKQVCLEDGCWLQECYNNSVEC